MNSKKKLVYFVIKKLLQFNEKKSGFKKYILYASLLQLVIL